MSQIERIPSNIPGLDELISGGFPKGSLVLVTGTPGSGKSNFCSQVLYTNALKGKRCLYLDLEQTEAKVISQMKQFGWDPFVNKNFKIVSIESSNPRIVEQVIREIENGPYDLIALDSLDSITTNPASIEEIQEEFQNRVPQLTIPSLLDQATLARLKIKKIFKVINKARATALLTSEKVEGSYGLSRDTVSEFLCDGVIVLSSTAIGKKRARSIEISKMRHTNTPAGRYDLEITDKGLVIQTL